MTISIDRAACATFWQDYLAALAPGHPHYSAVPDAFGFGGEPELADPLGALVLAGVKRATTCLPEEYASNGEALPKAGDLTIIVRGDGTPLALIERLSVVTKAFDDVTSEYAAVEGEGDGSLAYWREGHAEYFSAVARRLGIPFDGSTRVMCQVFSLIWPIRGA